MYKGIDDIQVGDKISFKCGERNCKNKFKAICINPSTMESVGVGTNIIYDPRNYEWFCVKHKTRKKKKYFRFNK